MVPARQPAHLHVQDKEWIVCEEAVAPRRRHGVLAEGLGALRVLPFQHRWRAVEYLVHVAAHTVQGQVVSHLQQGSCQAVQGMQDVIHASGEGACSRAILNWSVVRYLQQSDGSVSLAATETCQSG